MDIYSTQCEKGQKISRWFEHTFFDDKMSQSESSDADSDSGSSAVSVQPLYAGREKRVTAGNKLKALLDQEIDLEEEEIFKEDVNEVRAGMECGLAVKGYEVKEGDKIEVFEIHEVKRTL